MFRIFFVFLLLTFYVYGKEISFQQNIKFDVDIVYPDKEIFYVKEPLKVIFKVKPVNISEEALNHIKIVSDIKENVYIQKKSSLENGVLRKEFVFYFLKEGKSLLPFSIFFETDIFKERQRILSDRTFLIVPIPENIKYVGDFSIKGHFEGKNGVGTYTLKIKGKGFPFLPRHTLVVKNGSGKKVGYIVEKNLENVYQEEKFRIVYLDSLKIKPVVFKFFNPYMKRTVTLETKEISFSRKEIEEEPWKKLSETEKERFYIEKFKNLYPEAVEKKSFFQEVLKALYNAKYY
ncbi:MAG: hypothetical protein GXO21_02395, partial [Aquificae bacterium]|nr:hypothetical protein [Aquificota bacterium]